MKLSLSFLALALFAQTSLAHAAPDYGKRVAHKRLELALVLADALDNNAVCDAEAYPSTIVQTVNAAKYNVSEKTMKTFLAKISAQSELHQNLAFREATNQVNLFGPTMSIEELTKALTGTIFHHFGQGAYGSGYNVTLLAGGVAAERTLELLDDAPWYKWNDSQTTWSLVPSKDAPVIGYLLRVGNVEFRMDRSEQGAIWWVPTDVKEGETDYQRTLTTESSYCDA